MLAEPHGVLRIVDERRSRNFQANFAAGVLKPQPVFRNFDGAQRRANHFNFVLFKDAAFGELDGEIQSSLTAYGREQSVGLFFDDDGFEILLGEWLDVGAVGHLRVGHDRRRIRIDQNCFVAFVAQRFASLHTGIIKFASLANNDWPRPNDQNLLDVFALRHLAPANGFVARFRSRANSYRRELPGCFHSFIKSVNCVNK